MIIRKFLVVLVVGLFASLSYAGEFKITSNSVTMDSDMNAICSQQFGRTYQLADWTNNIISNWDSGKNVDNIIPHASKGEKDVWVSDNGSEFWTGSRHYLAARFSVDHVLPTSYTFLAHDNIDNNLLALGSWNSSLPVLCYSEQASVSVVQTLSGSGLVSDDGNYTIYEDPTYNGGEINNNPKTLNQWAKEQGLKIDNLETDIIYECYDPSETYPNCNSWGTDETYGYNHNVWEKHSCSYDGWGWDNCYNRPKKILIKKSSRQQATPTSCTSPKAITVSENLDIQIPSLNYTSLLGTQNLWVNLKYYGKSPNGEILWKLKDFGTNP